MAHLVVSVLRVIGPLLFGFVVGSLLSLALFPSLPSELEHGDGSLSVDCTAPLDQSDDNNNLPAEDTVEMRIHPPVLFPQSDTPNKKVKVSRPRFYATELDIKDKLFVAVLSGPTTIQTLGVASNRTVAHHVSKMVFFSQGEMTEMSWGPMNIVNYGITPVKALRVLHAFDYIGKHVSDNYDWFFIVPDTTYLKGFKLYELVTHLSIGKPIWMGRKLSSNPDFCDFQAGFLLSQDLMKIIINGLSACRQKIYQSENDNWDISLAIGECISSLTDIACSEDHHGKYLRTWNVAESESINQLILQSASNLESTNFNSALSVYPISKEVDFHKLHSHFCQLELDQLSQLTNSIQDEISDLTPETGEPASWPPGLPPPWSPKTRYETFKWEYFTDTLIFQDDLFENAVNLIGQDLKDVKQKYMENGKLEPGLLYKRLMNGYRLFDPSRGTDYIIDLIYTRVHNKEEVVKRVHLVRPLSKVEIIPVPYVTESTRISMLLPVRRFDVPAAQMFLSHYAKECLSSNENVRLIVVIMETSKEKSEDNQQGQAKFTKNSLHQDFVPLLRDIRSLRSQYLGKSKKELDTVKIRDLDDPVLLPGAMDAIVERYGRDVLYLWVTPQTQVFPQFLNRVRMNTIRSTQVFFPIPFKQFNPDLVFKASKFPGGPQPPPSTAQVDPSSASVPIQVHKNTGHFDRNDFSIASFYGSDLHNRNGSGDNHVDLINCFVGRGDMHIMRAVDPLLKVHFKDSFCDPHLHEEDYGRCLVSRGEGLASKPQLATLILQHNHDRDDNDEENNDDNTAR